MYKQDYSKYLNKSPKGNRKDILKKIWAWTKIGLFLFMVISMLWGCVQMFIPEYTVGTVVDMTGHKIYSPGVSFEIVITSLGDNAHKNHMLVPDGDGFTEYQYNVINNWAEAFTKTSSPYYGFFVYPLAYILVGMAKGMAGNKLDPSSAAYGVGTLFAILFTCILVRGFMLIFTFKAQKNQDKMQAMQLKQAEVQAKYKGSNDPNAKQKQQMELMALYKKEGISPMSAFTSSFVSMPVLFAMYAIVRSTHAIKVAQVGEIKLIEQPWAMTTGGDPIYFTLIAMYLPLQVLSMFLPMFLQMADQRKQKQTAQQKKARKRQIIMQTVFVAVFVFVVAQIASGVAIYWIFSSSFQVFQTIGFHIAKKTRPARMRRKKERLKLKNDKKAAALTVD